MRKPLETDLNFYLVLIVHATIITVQQLKAYDDCGHKLHMVGAQQRAPATKIPEYMWFVRLPLLALKRRIVSGSDS